MDKWMRFAADRKRQTIFILAAFFALLLPLLLLAPQRIARTYVITDGHRVMTYTTFATDPSQVLGDAGVALNEEDTYFTGKDGIQVCRAMRVQLRLWGQEQTVTSPGETVSQLLSRLDISLTGEDILSHDPEMTVWDGMELRVDRVTRQTEVYAAAIPHEVSYCSDASLPAGSREVVIPGSDGELICSAQVTYINFQETERFVTAQTMTRAPVTEVVAIGTGIGPEPADPDAPPLIGDGCIRLATGEVLTYSDTAQVRATAYTHTDEGCDFITYTGTTVRIGTVAVDPRYIPYGTRMFIVSNDGQYIYGISVAEDCGGAIKGDRIDLYFPTYYDCIQFGRRDCTIYFLT